MFLLMLRISLSFISWRARTRRIYYLKSMSLYQKLILIYQYM